MPDDHVGGAIYDVREPRELLSVTLSIDELGDVTRYIDHPDNGRLDEVELSQVTLASILVGVAQIIGTAATDLAVDLVRLGLVVEDDDDDE